jgi:hypothetical protein
MSKRDLTKIKHFIRVSLEIEASLSVSNLQKQILLKLLALWEKQTSTITVGLLVSSVEGVSERSVYRHLKILENEGWLSMTSNQKDQRIKIIQPSQQLIQLISKKLTIF